MKATSAQREQFRRLGGGRACDRSRQLLDTWRRVATFRRPSRVVPVGCIAVVVAVFISPAVAWAGSWGVSGGNTVRVGVSAPSSSSSAPQGGNTSHHGPSHADPKGTNTGGSATPPQMCTLTPLSALTSQSLAPGGPIPGQWYFVNCGAYAVLGPGAGLVWVPINGAPPGAPANPLALAQQAEDSIRLPGPTIHSNPANSSVVNVSTWLWVDPSAWQPLAASATAGGITATAVAIPSSVSWSMGDGGTVVCDGPGTPYDTSKPAGEQHTDCSYTYRQSSVGQPSPDGDPNGGAYPVTATITWGVAWSVTGAPGGGALPGLRTSSTVPLRVEQVESIGTSN